MRLKRGVFSLPAIIVASFAFTACSDSNPSSPIANNSAETSSSSESSPTSSSELLSSSDISASSSSSAQSATQTGFQTWHGTDKAQRINTGYDAGTGTSGYWYEVNDNSDGGLSKVVWGDATTDQCEGICGAIVLDRGTMSYSPFVAVAFDLAGKNAQGERVAIDATDMGGICITYTSDYAPLLELGLDEKQDSLFAITTPNVSLPKTDTPYAFNFKWSDFKMPSWATKLNNISGEDAAKQLVSIRFKIQAGPGTSKFDIIEVGSYGNCTYPPPPPPPEEQPYIDTNPNSDPNPNLPKTSPFETWYGNEDYFTYPINTGYDAGTETAGYWFTYGDDAINGASKILWPIDVCYEYEPGCFDVVFDYCEGICGTIEFNKGRMTEGSPFIGIGFNVAGEKNLNDYPLATADASAMGGVCVTYTSQIDIDLKLGIGDIEKEYDYNIPTKTLPKSTTYITKYVPWTDFKQPSEGNGKKISSEEAAKNLASIKFEMHGEHGTKAEFNIKSVGPYNGGECHP